MYGAGISRNRSAKKKISKFLQKPKQEEKRERKCANRPATSFQLVSSFGFATGAHTTKTKVYHQSTKKKKGRSLKRSSAGAD